MKTAARWAFATLAALGLLSGCGGSESNGGEGGRGGTGGSMQTLDRSNVSFVDNLLAKVESGEWTLGEGLVASLRLMAGEIDASSVLRHSELINYEGTGIVAMGRDYLEDGPDADAKAEITRLLALVSFSDEQLGAMVGFGSGAPAAPFQLDQIVPKDGAEDCNQFFYQGQGPPGVGQCLEVRSVSVRDGTYRVFFPAPPFPAAGWTEKHSDLVVEAYNEIVPVFKDLGKLPDVNIVFSVVNTPYLAQANPVNGSTCGVVLYKAMQGYKDSDFKQVAAHELAHCFQTDTFVKQNEVQYDFRSWREEGLAEYLSNVVYPHTNVEWTMLYTLELAELRVSLFDRSYDNFMFFQYLAQRLGNTGLFALIRTLPEGPGGGEHPQQAAKLAQYPNIDAIYHDFAKAMTDQQVIDTGGASIPYQLGEFNRPTVTITGPNIIMDDLEPFGVSRYLLSVEAGKEADLRFTGNGDLRESARPSDGLTWGKVPSTLLGDDCTPGIILVATTTKPNGGFELEIPEVNETPGAGQGAEASCGIEGQWVVDNSSLRIRPMAFTLDYVNGEIRVTFGSDGNVLVVYDDFEYRVYDDDTLSVLGMEFEQHEEFIYTTNAQGTTTYEVNGNEIEFGAFFESSYLEGTTRVHWIKYTDPPDQIGPPIDQVTTRDADDRGLFGGYQRFDLQSNGSVMRFLLDEEVLVILNRAGPAGG